MIVLVLHPVDKTSGGGAGFIDGFVQAEDIVFEEQLVEVIELFGQTELVGGVSVQVVVVHDVELLSVRVGHFEEVLEEEDDELFLPEHAELVDVVLAQLKVVLVLEEEVVLDSELEITEDVEIDLQLDEVAGIVDVLVVQDVVSFGIEVVHAEDVVESEHLLVDILLVEQEVV